MKEILLNENNQTLHTAVLTGNLDLVRDLLEKKENPNLKNSEGYTPLHYAAREGHLKILKLLVKYGGEINIFSHNDRNLMHEAAEYGHLEVVKYLFQMGVEFDFPSRIKLSEIRLRKDKVHPLVLAEKNKHRAIVNFFIINGARARPFLTTSEFVEILDGVTQAKMLISATEIFDLMKALNKNQTLVDLTLDIFGLGLMTTIKHVTVTPLAIVQLLRPILEKNKQILRLNIHSTCSVMFLGENDVPPENLTFLFSGLPHSVFIRYRNELRYVDGYTQYNHLLKVTQTQLNLFDDAMRHPDEYMRFLTSDELKTIAHITNFNIHNQIHDYSDLESYIKKNQRMNQLKCLDPYTPYLRKLGMNIGQFFANVEDLGEKELLQHIEKLSEEEISNAISDLIHSLVYKLPLEKFSRKVKNTFHQMIIFWVSEEKPQKAYKDLLKLSLIGLGFRSKKNQSGFFSDKEMHYEYLVEQPHLLVFSEEGFKRIYVKLQAAYPDYLDPLPSHEQIISLVTYQKNMKAIAKLLRTENINLSKAIKYLGEHRIKIIKNFIPLYLQQKEINAQLAFTLIEQYRALEICLDFLKDSPFELIVEHLYTRYLDNFEGEGQLPLTEYDLTLYKIAAILSYENAIETSNEKDYQDELQPIKKICFEFSGESLECLKLLKEVSKSIQNNGLCNYLSALDFAKFDTSIFDYLLREIQKHHNKNLLTYNETKSFGCQIL